MSGAIQGVFFDLDGTLVDTWRLYIECYREVLNEFYGESLSAQDVVDLRPKAEIRFFMDPRHVENYETLYEMFVRAYAENHTRWCDGPYAGAFETVRGIQERDFAVAVITGKRRAAYNITARETGLPAIETAICDDDVNFPKPDSEGLMLACRRLDVDPEQMIYVGDSEVDVHAARQIGAYFAGTLYSKNAEEQAAFQELCAGDERTRMLEEPADLLLLLDELAAPAP